MKEIPSAWAQTTLGNLTEYVTSGSRDWSKYYAEAGSLFVRTQDINTNKLADTNSIAKVFLPASVEGKRTLIRKDDLLITITGANVGRCAHVVAELPEAYVSQSVALVRLLDPSLGRFVHLQLLAPSDESGKTSLEARAYGMGRPVLNLDNVRETPLLIPPRQEQQRIANKLETVLTCVDDVNSRLARIAPILKRFRQSVLAAATSGRLTEDWRMNHPRTFAWASMPLSNVCIKITDGEHISPARRPHGVPLLTAKNVAQRGLSFDDTHFVSEEDAKVFWLRCKPEIGDTLVCSRGTIGRSVLIETDRPFCLMGTVILLKPNPALVRSKYLALAVSAPRAQEEMKGASGATAVSALYLKDIKPLELALPELDEQVEIVRRVETLFAFADRLEARLQTAKTATERLTPALLAKAFRGELVPQDPNDEPASELLRRLQQAAPPTSAKRGRKSAA